MTDSPVIQRELFHANQSKSENFESTLLSLAWFHTMVASTDNRHKDLLNSTLDDTPVDVSLWFIHLRNSLWLFGIPSWIFGIFDRGYTALIDGYVSPIEFIHIFTASAFFLGWLALNPDKKPVEVDALQSYRSDTRFHPLWPHLEAIKDRLQELSHYHLIRQEYLLPVPYLCQIYHLLNLKHLESVHSFSLNNLKIVQVNDYRPSAIGGTISFQTVLESPFNILRIWRQPIVEVELTLHSQYTVELKIPVYNDKCIVVIFNAVPAGPGDHYFLIDIYSNLSWYRPLLQGILHIASCLTLLEDLPYLRKLATKNWNRLMRSRQTCSHETMRLFKRFVELHGATLQSESSQFLLEQTAASPA